MAYGYKFAEYELRPVTEADRDLLERWIAADPDHRDRVKPEYFLAEEPGVEAMLFLHNGEPCFFFRMARALRISIQFPPTETRQDQAANARHMADGIEWLKQAASKAQLRELIFDSRVPELRKFCNKRFGFVESPNELVCPLPVPAAVEVQETNAR